MIRFIETPIPVACFQCDFLSSTQFFIAPYHAKALPGMGLQIILYGMKKIRNILHLCFRLDGLETPYLTVKDI